MGMNPDTEEFEALTAQEADEKRAEGWPVFEIGEEIEVRGWRFEVMLCEGKALVLRGAGKADAVSQHTEAVDELRRQLVAASKDIEAAPALAVANECGGLLDCDVGSLKIQSDSPEAVERQEFLKRVEKSHWRVFTAVDMQRFGRYLLDGQEDAALTVRHSFAIWVLGPENQP